MADAMLIAPSLPTIADYSVIGPAGGRIFGEARILRTFIAIPKS